MVHEPHDILRFPARVRSSLASLLVRWLTLLSFIAGTIGVPLEPFSLWGQSGGATCAKRSGETCRCSSVSRSLGACCCKRGVKPAVSSAQGSELQAEAATVSDNERCSRQARSCCAHKSVKTPARTTASTSPTLTIEGCPCGDASPHPLLWLCGDPRVLPADVEVAVIERSPSTLPLVDLSPRGMRPRPQVPPPKSLPA